MRIEGWSFRLWLRYRLGRFLGWFDGDGNLTYFTAIAGLLAIIALCVLALIR